MRTTRLALCAVALSICLAGTTGPAWPASDVGELGDLVYIQNVTVAPGARDDPTQITDAGVIDVDGYSRLVLSLAFESNLAVSKGGKVGVVLIPDYEIFDRLLDAWQVYAFPIEVSVDVQPGSNQIQIGEQVEATVGFARYRVLMYNSTNTTASAFLYVYRHRCGN